MDRAFELAFAQRQHFALGARLEPLSLGHVFLLHRFSSPYIKGGSVSVHQLLMAIFICCQPYTKAESNLKKWWLPWLLKVWTWRARKLILKDEEKAFSEYLTESFAIASIRHDPRTSSDSLHTPWPIRLLAVLMKEFHLPMSQAMDMPVILANAICVANGEATGAIHLWNDQDRSFWEFARKMDEQKFGVAKEN